MNATSIGVLMNEMKKVYKDFLGVQEVYFFFITEEIAQMIMSEGIEVTETKIEHYTFYYPHLNHQNAIPEAKFSNFADVAKFKNCKGHYCVWPVTSFENKQTQNFICFMQLHLAKDCVFNLDKDRKLLDLFGYLFQSIMGKLASIQRVEVGQLRSKHMFEISKHVFSARSHTQLQCFVETLFPKYFNFEYCSVLYMEAGDFIKIRLNPSYTDKFLQHHHSKVGDCEDSSESEHKDN